LYGGRVPPPPPPLGARGADKLSRLFAQLSAPFPARRRFGRRLSSTRPMPLACPKGVLYESASTDHVPGRPPLPRHGAASGRRPALSGRLQGDRLRQQRPGPPDL